jgi:hypothetical protein
LFISEPIEIEVDPQTKMPIELIWRKKAIKIIEVVLSWQDWGFAGGVHKANWRQRHHRNYYQLKGDDQHVYEVYLDRGIAGEPKWFLYRIIDSDTT